MRVFRTCQDLQRDFKLSVDHRLASILTRLFLALMILGTVVLATFGSATADSHGPVVVIDIPGKSGSTHEIKAGPDGNLWVTQQKQARLVRVTVSGEVTTFAMPDGSGPHGLAFDDSGRMWVSLEFSDEIAHIGFDGRILARYPIPQVVAGPQGPHGLAVGPDGALWWTGKTGNTIGRLHPTSGLMDVFPLKKTPAKPIYITAGSDGNMWFTELEGSRIGRITAKGEITSFDIPTPDARPIVVFTGPEGKIWFTEERGNAYGTISSDGTFVEYHTGVDGGKLAGAAFDGAGNLWLQFNSPDIIQRVAPDQTVTTFKLTSSGAVQHRITLGPEGRMWFTELATDKVGYIATE
jgi:virginiamycin B lyase